MSVYAPGLDIRQSENFHTSATRHNMLGSPSGPVERERESSSLEGDD